jgi:copper chaperone CopZ
VPVIVILAIGAGSAAFAVSFIQYTPEFLAVGIIFLLAMFLYNIKKMNHGRLNMHAIKKERHLILRSLLILGVVWGVITYGITPLVAPGVYNSALQTSEFDSTSPQSNIVTENAKAVVSIIPPESKVKTPVTSEDSEGEKNQPQTNDSKSKLTPSNIRVVKLRIDGMYCPSCVYSEQATLSSLKGVLKVNVWLGWFFSPSGAEVVYDSSQISAEDIREAATYYVFKANIENDTPIQ